ncbi:hypothetical protein KAI12_04060, partial [Candidatus Bathyarchaeota archaeon]|nr:hypothetical protein [Candidatus Bathyarchaeota archaeon]
MGKRIDDKKLVRTMVVLLRNTTWRCGKIEKPIVSYLRKRKNIFGKSETALRDVMKIMSYAGFKRQDFLDALK